MRSARSRALIGVPAFDPGPSGWIIAPATSLGVESSVTGTKSGPRDPMWTPWREPFRVILGERVRYSIVQEGLMKAELTGSGVLTCSC